jgi:hypothetical protein
MRYFLVDEETDRSYAIFSIADEDDRSCVRLSETGADGQDRLAGCYSYPSKYDDFILDAAQAFIEDGVAGFRRVLQKAVENEKLDNLIVEDNDIPAPNFGF